MVPSRPDVDLLTTIVVRRLTDDTVSTSSEWVLNPDYWFLAFIRHVPLFVDIDCQALLFGS